MKTHAHDTSHLLAFYVEPDTIPVLRRRAIPFGGTLDTQVINQMIVTYDDLMEQGRRELETALYPSEWEAVLTVLIWHLLEGSDRASKVAPLYDLWQMAVAQGVIQPTRKQKTLAEKLEHLSPLASAALVDHARLRCRRLQKQEMKIRSQTSGPFASESSEPFASDLPPEETASVAEPGQQPEPDEVLQLYRDGKIGGSMNKKLHRLGFTTLTQIAATSPREMLLQSFVGEATIRTVRNLLHEHGLVDEDSPWK